MLRAVLKKRVKSHFVICLKGELVGRMLTLLNSEEEEGFEEFREMRFVNVVGKEHRPNTPSQLTYSTSGWKTVEVLTQEFF